MGEDREVLREVWLGRIPAAFSLAAEDLASTSSTPELFHVMLPRLSYFALVTDKVRSYFSKYVPENLTTADIWLDFEGNPIKLHLPIGVLFDQLNLEGSNPSAVGPPWKLTVHFGQFPSKDIMKCNTKEAVEAYFMSCVKEADQFKHGGKIVSAMQKKDHNQLWLGLSNDKFDQFWAINRRLMETIQPVHAASPSSSTEASNPTALDSSDSAKLKTFKHIPVRVYNADQLLPQKLVKPTKSAENGGSNRLATLQNLLEDYFPNQDISQGKVLTQGIEPDLDTPIQWMAEHLSYPDNFLHIVFSYKGTLVFGSIKGIWCHSPVSKPEII